MSGINRRTVFMDSSKGTVRFHDHALVQTDLGVMVEPFIPFQRIFPDTVAGAQNYDPTDWACRVDKIEEVPMDKEISILFGGSGAIHGGAVLPRAGY